MALEALRHGGRVAGALLKAAVLTQLQYRVDFLIQCLMHLFWFSWTLVPLLFIFEIRETLAGYGPPQALLVLAAFLMLKAALEGVINPNLLAVVEHIRRGTLDFVLIKPADSQLLVSLGRINAARAVDLVAAAGLVTWSLPRLSPSPGLLDLAAGLAMLFAGTWMLYSLWLLVICAAFWFVRVDNLAYLFASIFDAGRWPIDVFRGWVRVVLTFVLPVAVMTSFPALATLGRLGWPELAGALAGSAVLALISRVIWRLAVRGYSSASS
jgi:ABC-2 type transport system permease protein